MESLVIPTLILVTVAAGVAVAARAFARRSGTGAAAPTASPAQKTGPKNQGELARQAAARLSEVQHRRIYALIAQGKAVAAIKAYNELTGQGLRASRDAVVALAAHPQQHQGEQQVREQEPAAGQPERFPYRYRAIASKGELTREVSSNMLNDSIYSHIKDLAGNGDLEAAAVSLARHSDISLPEAREFVALLSD